MLAASVVLEAAVGILAAAGQNAVQVSWLVFLLLTLGVFVGLLGYWTANPIAKVYGEMNDGIAKQREDVERKRRECVAASFWQRMMNLSCVLACVRNDFGGQASGRHRRSVVVVVEGTRFSFRLSGTSCEAHRANLSQASIYTQLRSGPAVAGPV